MYIDALLLLSNGQQITADAVSTNTIDTNPTVASPAPQIGTGEPMGLAMVITAVGTNTGSAKIQAIQSAAANLGSPDVIGEVDLVTADLVAGKAILVPIPPGYGSKRYLGANYDITGTVDFTVKTWLVPQELFSILAKAYAKNYVV